MRKDEEDEEKEEERRRKEQKVTLIKSRDPHLAARTIWDSAAAVQSVLVQHCQKGSQDIASLLIQQVLDQLLSLEGRGCF